MEGRKKYGRKEYRAKGRWELKVRFERRADVGSKERYAALSLYNLRKVMNHTIGSEIR